MKNNWKTIVLMALNGAGVDEKEADLQIRVITPMMEEYLAEQKKEWMEEQKVIRVAKVSEPLN